MHFLKTLGILGLYARGSGFCVSILGLLPPLKESGYRTNVKYRDIKNYLVAGVECGSARTHFYVVEEVRKSWGLPARSLSTWGWFQTGIRRRYFPHCYFSPFWVFFLLWNDKEFLLPILAWALSGRAREKELCAGSVFCEVFHENRRICVGGGVAGRGDVGNSEKRKEGKPQQRCIIELVTRGSWDSVPLGPPWGVMENAPQNYLPKGQKREAFLHWLPCSIGQGLFHEINFLAPPEVCTCECQRVPYCHCVREALAKRKRSWVQPRPGWGWVHLCAAGCHRNSWRKKGAERTWNGAQRYLTVMPQSRSGPWHSVWPWDSGKSRVLRSVVGPLQD